MKDVPTRAQLSKLEKLARRLLNHHKQQEVRVLAKGLLWLIAELDAYAESLYPCFELMEVKLRQDRATITVDPDGWFRLKGPEKQHISSGQNLKDLFINVLLWSSDWVEEEDFAETCQKEDIDAGIEAILEMNQDDTDS